MGQEELKVGRMPFIARIYQWSKDNFQYIPPIFISLILLTGQLTFGILDSYVNLIAAIATSIVAEIILARLILGTWKNLSSAYISGISVGILIRSNVVWPYIITALISILSKYVIRYKGRHLWNPSNFGVSWMLALNTMSVAGLSIQWGSNFAALSVIWALGLMIVYRAKRFHVTITYVISFIVLAYVRSLMTSTAFLAELAPLTGPMYQLFIFFMITDPPTSVSTRKGRIIVAVLIAVVEFFLRLNDAIYAPFYALFLVGPLAKYIDMRWLAPKAKAQTASA
ncbi:RnfABCDGE type electron transport complex subunit D [Marinilongibacter aquaticus]|uniref:RnfABCDGE type electron transport complex subunit D n=1 Tax=Marinilongibacter aquaticus TaxID=2975157 RepID=UPI0021BD5567|nr:RnfABCDGE type electron transport complex subunit D [Marinilongibacter aquaticus]UBM60505.1 RnfABCDGE type electron transport complex subunit D [Marinilongibacter aquaticus]